MLLRDGGLSFAPAILAERSPQVQSSYYYPISEGVQLERQYAYYGLIYRYQPWVRVVVDKLANALARLNMEVWKGADRDRDHDDGPYAKLIANPCPTLSPYAFWLWVQTTVEIYGEAFLVKIRDADDKPVALLPMHPSRTAIKRGEDGTRTYIFSTMASTSQGLMEFSEDDVIPIQLYSPDDTMRGLSRLESLRSTLVSEDSGRTATSAMWRNAGRPNLVLSSTKTLGTEGRRRLRESFDSYHAGSANAGKTLVLEDGVSASALQLTAVEMQFVQSRQLNREEVCAVFDVAPPMVHILDRATYSNISAQMRAFYRDTMAPKLEHIESQLDCFLGCEFGDDLHARFAVDEVLRGDYETRAEAAQKLVLAGVMKPSEAREVMDLPAAGPEADKLYAQSSVQPLGEPAEEIRLQGELAPGGDPDGVPIAAAAPDDLSANPPAPPTKPPRPAPPAKPPAKATDYARAIKGGLGRGLSLPTIAARLAAKHPTDHEHILDAARLVVSGAPHG